MKRFISALVLVAMLLSFAACGGETAETVPTATTETPELFVTNTLIKDGASDYTIVYEDNSDAAALAVQLRLVISENFGIRLPAAEAGDQEGEFEIIIGNARPIAQETAGKLRGQMDFAMTVEANALVLCAADSLSYKYLAAYLKHEVFAKKDTAELTLSSDDNIFYTSSHLAQKNFIQYMQETGATFNLDTVFARDHYQNSDTLLPYRIYVPFNYSADKPCPLLVNLHGAGERGDDNESHLLFLDTMLFRTELPLDDAIIICPQCPEGNKWVDTSWGLGSYRIDDVPESNELRAVVELVQEVMQNYPVDESRIYASGFSMGGYGTWDLLMRHPDLFCAGVPMCGAGDPSKAEIFRDVPVWAVHGAKDTTVPVSGSRDMANAFQKAGITDARYTELGDAGHNVWTYTYTNEEMLQWLFSQKKAG